VTTRATYYIVCDLCNESGGHSHNEETARQEVQPAP
jgi:hypothetical protein